MEREIKFRGISEDTDKWIYGSYHKPFEGVEQIIENKKNNASQMSSAKTGTCGQFTSLKDKNAFEIYEGDILEDSFNGNRIKIRYLANSFVGQYISEKYFGGNIENRNYLQWIVVGNIHENPELL